MPTIDDVAKQPLADRLARLARSADDYAEAIRGRDDRALSRRPDAKNWAAKEVVCHVRDIEENFMGRFQMVLSMEDPKFLPVSPDRWAEERQYLRCDTVEALAAFRKRREETLAFVKGLKPADWKRGGVHATRGRMTIEDFITMLAWHDDNHLDQLKRALKGEA